MTTARDLITIALFDAGVFGTGQTPQASDINNGLTRLNDMIAQWQRQRWLIWCTKDVSMPMTGALSYTIGTGQYFNTPRPDRLEDGCFLRQITPAVPNQPDWPMKLVQSHEAYNQIRLKRLGSFAQCVFYDSAFPYGNIFPWPLPSNLYELHLLVKEQLQSFVNLSTVYNMPEEYKRAIRFNLQEEFLSAYRLPPDDKLSMRAAAALNVIRNANAQIPVLKMPADLYRPGLYDVFSDTSY